MGGRPELVELVSLNQVESFQTVDGVHGGPIVGVGMPTIDLSDKG